MFRDVKQLKETQPDAFDVLKNFPVKFQDEATVDAFGEYSISYAHPAVIKYVADFDLCCNIIYYFLQRGCLLFCESNGKISYELRVNECNRQIINLLSALGNFD